MDYRRTAGVGQNTATLERNWKEEFRKFENMNIQSLKIELVKHILETDSQELLDKILSTIKKEQPDFWLELSEEQKAEIELGRKQIENGDTETWDSVYKRLA